MSRHATAYVLSLDIANETARKVFLLLAERTTAPGDPYRPEDVPEIMVLGLQRPDIPALAVRAGLAPEEFRQQLRGLKQHVRMDVIEYSDGLWEIIYGPAYNRPPRPRTAESDLPKGGSYPFWMPDWDKHSTWGYEQGGL